ncbi:HlyD family efflux transporter periplasmic adaptor subunit [Rugosimonospora acidiphila]|uniref:HlyD family efflux transporter periplasmic adaptor subunit n=1 Tax=Rugosimonospora acidiphila TaxID=556531 RepID=A0ABP9S833_9ACTN
MKFRGRALQKMREPDELDRPIMLVDTRGWTALFVILSVVLGAAIWSVNGNLPITMTAPGILTSAEGNRAVTTPYAGTVAIATAKPGQRVSAGDTLLDVTGEDQKRRTVTAPIDGMVLTMAGAVGQTVSPGDTVATIQAGSGASDLVTLVFVPTSQATSVRPGIDVLLAVEGVPQPRFGLLKGTVLAVGRFPIDPSMAVGIVGSPYTANELTRGQPTVPVTIKLKTDGRTKSGFAWTSADGPPFQISPQQKVAASFHLGNRTPFDVILRTS